MHADGGSGLKRGIRSLELDGSYLDQACDGAEGEVLRREPARGDDPEDWVVGCFIGEASEAVGEVDEDGMVVAVELFLHVIEEGFEAGAATADGFFEVVMLGSEWSVQGGIGVVEFAVDLRVEPKDFSNLAEECSEFLVADGTAGIDGDAD